jgi:hypothetical protein
MGSQPLFPNQFLLVCKRPLEEFNLGLRESSLKTPRPVLHKNTPLPRTLRTDILAAELFGTLRRRVAAVEASVQWAVQGPAPVFTRI